MSFPSVGAQYEAPLSLGLKQELFVRLQAEWVLRVLSHPGWTLRDGEGRIFQLGPENEGRRVRAMTGQLLAVRDAVHREGSTHYHGVGKDWVLLVDGVVVEASDHPAWLVCGELWESMHPLCRWGGRFGDAGHTSFEHEGVS